MREPVPEAWLVPVTPPVLSGTWGYYVSQCEVKIQQCNLDKQKIQEWNDAEGQ